MQYTKSKRLKFTFILLITLLIGLFSFQKNSFAATPVDESNGYSGGGMSVEENGKIATFSLRTNDSIDLSAEDQYSTLLASFIFTRSNEKAHELNYSYNDLAYFRTKDPSGGGKDGSYGNGFVNSKDINKEGVITSRYLATLYDYDWLVPLTNASMENGASVFFKFLFGQIKDTAKSTLASISLSTASDAAFIFDGTVAVMKKFTGLFSTIDLAQIFGLDKDKGNGVANQSSGNLIESIIGFLQTSVGFTGQALRYIRYIFYFIICASFIIMLMTSLVNYKGSKLSLKNRTRRFISRVLVIIFLIPTSNAVMSIFDKLTNTFTDDFASPVIFSQNYVVDTLHWAIVGNLNLDMINPSPMLSGGGGEGSVGKPYEQFRPSAQNVQTLSSTVEMSYSNLNLNDSNLKTSATSAAELVSNVASKKAADVNDYLSGISSARNSSATNMAAGQTVQPGMAMTAGEMFNSSSEFYSDKMPNSVHFLTRTTTETWQKVEEKVNKIFKLTDSGYVKLSDVPPSDDPDEKPDEDNKDEEVDQNEYNGYRPVMFNDSFEAFFNAGATYYSAKELKWNSPSTYIYGAEASGNNKDETTYIKNYLNTAGTNQNNNPMTGNNSVKENANMKKAMFTNSLAIAIQNKYSGVATINGGVNPSLSTQSVVFLLQTGKPTNGLQYMGTNTAPNDEASGANKGVSGVTFARYVIPNEGPVDLTGKIGSFTIMWIASAIGAVMALLYLIMSPLLGALLQAIKAFLSAGLTGNIISYFEYIIRMVEIKSAFTFALFGAFITSVICSQIIDSMPIVSTVVGVTTVTSWTNIFSASGTIVICFIIVLASTWPTINLGIGKKGKKVSILGAIVMAPCLLGDSAVDWLNTMHQRIYGRSKKTGFFGQIQNRVTPVPMKEHTDKVKQVGKIATGAAVAVATGGTSLAAMGASSQVSGAAGLALKGKKLLNARRSEKITASNEDLIGDIDKKVKNIKGDKNNYKNGDIKSGILKDDAQNEVDKEMAIREQLLSRDRVVTDQTLQQDAELMNQQELANADMIDSVKDINARLNDDLNLNANINDADLSVDDVKLDADDVDVDLSDIEKPVEFDKIQKDGPMQTNDIANDVADKLSYSNNQSDIPSDVDDLNVRNIKVDKLLNPDGTVKDGTNEILGEKTASEINNIAQSFKDGKITEDERNDAIAKLINVKGDNVEQQSLNDDNNSRSERTTRTNNSDRIPNDYTQYNLLGAKPIEQSSREKLVEKNEDKDFESRLFKLDELDGHPLMKSARFNDIKDLSRKDYAQSKHLAELKREKDGQILHAKEVLASNPNAKDSSEQKDLINQLVGESNSLKEQSDMYAAKAEAQLRVVEKSVEKINQANNGLRGQGALAGKFIVDNIRGTDPDKSSVKKQMDINDRVKANASGNPDLIKKILENQEQAQRDNSRAMDRDSVEKRRQENEMQEIMRNLADNQTNLRNKD